MPLKAMSTWTDVFDIPVIKNHILAVNFYKCSLSIHATHIFSSNNVAALIIFPQAFKNLFEVLVLLKC